MDREKVIKEYEDYVNSYISLTTSHDYEFEMHKDVLAILKEQKTVKPKKIKGFKQPCYVHYDFVCENCNTDLIYKQPYCAGCGRWVKWE